ncbi:nucleotidyltransferase family protein [Pleurocapsales cyanobacterium LEGE 10410]|nr:nucleotidyltransferase family protein [Pleurocapsales cyanobacterium LEGE 10410]
MNDVKLKTQNFALILAAGRSTRMGTCKTALPWSNGQTLLRYQAEQFLQANITPIVVLGSHNAHRRADCPPGSRVVINHQGDRGKTGSILTGLKLIPQSCSTITVSAVDQPRPASIYQTLLQTYYQKKPLIVAPCYRGKLGHPLLFSARLLPLLKDIQESSLGLRKIVRQFYAEIKQVEFTTARVLSDLNNEESYHKARCSFGK